MPGQPTITRAALCRDLRRYHAGALALTDTALERRLFGRGDGAPDEAWRATLRRLGQHKFEEDAPHYAVIRACVGLLPHRDTTLLDIGCGRGRVLLYAGLLGAARVTGIEILETRAALARHALAAHLAPGAATILEGDALKLPWPRADALVAMNPFFPAQYRRFRARLTDYARERALLVIAAGTLRDRLAADRTFCLQARAKVGWIELGAFEVRP